MVAVTENVVGIVLDIREHDVSPGNRVIEVHLGVQFVGDELLQLLHRADVIILEDVLVEARIELLIADGLPVEVSKILAELDLALENALTKLVAHEVLEVLELELLCLEQTGNIGRTALVAQKVLIEGIQRG